MSEFWKMMIILNVALIAGALCSFCIEKTLTGKLRYKTSKLILLLSLVLPIIAKFAPINISHHVLVSAQEVWSFDMAPPVLPGGEGSYSSLPVLGDKQSLKSENVHRWSWKITLYWLYFITFFYLAFMFIIKFAKLNKYINESIIHKDYSNVSVLVHSTLAIPFSCFIKRKPVVVIPSHDLASPRLKWILRHEFEHIRCGDHIVSLLIELLTIIFFLNPAAYWWRKSILESMEYSCDESVMNKNENKKDYIDTLLEIAKRTINKDDSLIMCAGMSSLGGENHSVLQRRIKMILKRTDLKRWQIVIAVSIVTLASSIASVVGLTTKKDDSYKSNFIKEKKVKELLISGIKKANAKRGYVVISNPKTGKVVYAKGFDEHENDLGKSFLSTPYPPFSLMKPIIASPVLDDGLTNVDDTHFCEKGIYKINKKSYKDWKAFDYLTTKDTVAKSSNICSIKIADKMDTNRLMKKMKEFGFGNGSLASFYPSATSGFLRKYSGENEIYQKANLASGNHAIYVTPLEIVGIYGAFANNGILHSPSKNGLPDKSRRVLSEKTSQEMRDILRKVVTDGTGLRAKSNKIKIGGKTASSPGQPYTNVLRASFIGMAPISNPEYVVYVIMEDYPKGGHGGKVAAPVVKNIFEIL